MRFNSTLNPVHPIQGTDEDVGFTEGIYNLEETGLKNTKILNYSWYKIQMISIVLLASDTPSFFYFSLGIII